MFTTKWRGYNSGEVATFGARLADQLLAQKYAKPFTRRVGVTKAEDEMPVAEKKKRRKRKAAEE